MTRRDIDSIFSFGFHSDDAGPCAPTASAVDLGECHIQCLTRNRAVGPAWWPSTGRVLNKLNLKESKCLSVPLVCSAAGDAAHAAGNNWVASCLCTVCGFGCSPFVRCADRQAAKAKHGVDDGCSPGLTCLGSCCCGCCFVTQQLNQELSTGKALKDVILHIVSSRKGEEGSV